MADLGEVGTANVELRAEMKRLKGDLNRARGTSAKAGTKAGKAFGQKFGASAKKFIGPALAGLIGTAALRGFVRGANKAIDKLDEIAKTADGIGLTTDALQELRVAADLSGVDIGALNASMRRFARTASDANNDLSTAVRAFESVGVSVTDADGKLKSIDVLLEDVADGFKGMSNATQRAATAQELFGRAGTTMVNMLVQGKEGISAMRQEARDLGIVIEEDLIRKSVIAKDELTLLERVIDAELTVALVRLGPVLVGIAGFFADVVTATANAAEGFRRLISGEIFSTKASQLRIELGQTREELDKLGVDFKAFQETGVATPFLQLSTGIEEEGFIFSGDTFEQALEKAAVRAAEIGGRISEIQEELVALSGENLPTIVVPPAPPPGDTPDAAAATTVETSDEVQRQIESEVRLREEIGATIQTLGEEESVRKRLLSQMELDRLERDLQTAAIAATTDEQREEIAKAQELLPVLRAITAARHEDQVVLDDKSAALEKAADAEREFASAIKSTGDELIRAAFEGGNFIQILANLTLRLIEMQALQFAQGGGGGGGGLLGTILNATLGAIGAGVGGTINLSGGAPTSSPIPIPRPMAGGGIPRVGGLSLIGEEGPELLRTGSSSRIFSNEELSDALAGASNRAGGDVKVEMTVVTPDVAGFNRSQPQILGDVGRMIRIGQQGQA